MLWGQCSGSSSGLSPLLKDTQTGLGCKPGTFFAADSLSMHTAMVNPTCVCQTLNIRSLINNYNVVSIKKNSKENAILIWRWEQDYCFKRERHRLDVSV